MNFSFTASNLKLSLYACIAFLGSCISVRPAADITPKNLSQKSAIIVVPGYYGTALANTETGDRLHLTFGKAMFGGPPLAVNFSALDIPDAVQARTDGVLDSCTILPGLYAIDIHGALFDNLDKQFPSSKVIPFAYDWRGSDAKSAEDLGRLVDDVRKAGAKKIAIIGFSNGGTVTSYYLRYGGQTAPDSATETWEGAKKIDAVVLIGAPFRGTMRSFYNMLHGVSFGLAKTPLNPVAMSTFPSLYELLPAESEKLFLTSNRTVIEDAMYVPELWRERGWGLFKPGQRLSAKTKAKRERYLKEKLAAGTAFSARMIDNTTQPLEEKLNALALIGKGRRTLEKAQWSAAKIKEKGHWNFDDKTLYGDGDGTILYTSANPPEAYQKSLKIQRVESKVEHAKMVSDDGVLGSVDAFLKQQGF